jgi:hypothetical protein
MVLYLRDGAILLLADFDDGGRLQCDLILMLCVVEALQLKQFLSN